MNMASREELVYLLKAAEMSEDHDRMVRLINECVWDEPVPEEERNLISLAYMCATNVRKSGIRILNSVIAIESAKGCAGRLALAREYRSRIVRELLDLVDNYERVIDRAVLTPATPVETRVLFGKIKGDYCRSACEHAEDSTAYRERALAHYEAAMALAGALSAASVHRLGVLLSAGLFYREVLGRKGEARQLLVTAREQALAGSEQVCKDSEFFLTTMKDAIDAWTDEDN